MNAEELTLAAANLQERCESLEADRDIWVQAAQAYDRALTDIRALVLIALDQFDTEPDLAKGAMKGILRAIGEPTK